MTLTEDLPDSPKKMLYINVSLQRQLLHLSLQSMICHVKI